MSFDHKKPHGTVWGVHNASYVQNGVLYDCDFNPVEETAPEDGQVDATAACMLREMLEAGSINRRMIVEESERRGISWIDVEAAKIDLGVMEVAAGRGFVWRFKDYE